MSANSSADRRDDSKDHSSGMDETIAPSATGRLNPDSGPGADETLAPGAGQAEAPLPGTNVRYFGDYELIEEIARGGMGVVYKARQVSLNRVVALKMILAGQLAGKDDVKRFHAEAEAAANLDHPGIVPIYEIGEHDGKHYFSMAYVDGGGLAGLLKDGPLPPRLAAEYTQKVAAAIAFAHERGVIHRDLKPGNVLLDRNGEPKITDFGLAKHVKGESQLTTTGQILGTPSYMPPEQAAGDIGAIGPPADIYSLGAVLYALLTGRPPFQSDSPLDTLLQVREREPIGPRQLNPKVPGDLETICLKCLEKAASRRYESAQALADELGRYLRGEPILARPIGTVERGWRWCRRKPVLAAFVALAAVFAGVLCFGGPLWAMREGRLRMIATEQREIAQQRKSAAERATAEAYSQRIAAQQATADANRQKKEAEKQRDTAELRLYGSQIAAAQSELGTNSFQAAGQQLDATRKELRGWEYAYVRKLIDTRFQVLKGHSSPVWSMSFHADGKQVVSGSDDSTVKVWDAISGQQRLTLRGTGAVRCVAYSSDGKWIASGSSDRTVTLWDAASGTKVLTYSGHTSGVKALAFSPDGKRIVSAGGEAGAGELKVWDSATGKDEFTLGGHSHVVSGVAYSPDGKRVASGSFDMTVKVWDATTGQETHTLSGHKNYVHCVAFNPDGTRIVSGSSDRTARVWDAQTGQELFELKGHTAGVKSVAFSADGTRIVSTGGSDRTIKIWDAVVGSEILTLSSSADLHCVAFSPDGKRIGGSDANWTIYLWDAVKGDASRTFRASLDETSNTALSPGLVSGSFSPDGMRIVAGSYDKTLMVWDMASGQQLLKLQGHDQRVNAAAFSPDGKQIASGSADKTVKVWDAIAGAESFTLRGHRDAIRAVAFSPDGKRIMSAGEDQMVIVWDATTRQQLHAWKCDTRIVSSAAFSPNGDRIVTGIGGMKKSVSSPIQSNASFDKNIKVWDSTNGQELLTLAGHRYSVASVAFSPDGMRLVSGGYDPTIKVWDLASRREIFTLSGHTGRITSVAFSPDGKRITSGSDDRTIRLWDVASGQEVLSLRKHSGEVTCLAFSPDGHRIVSSSADGTVRIWEAGPGKRDPSQAAVQ